MEGAIIYIQTGPVRLQAYSSSQEFLVKDSLDFTSKRMESPCSSSSSSVTLITSDPSKKYMTQGGKGMQERRGKLLFSQSS